MIASRSFVGATYGGMDDLCYDRLGISLSFGKVKQFEKAPSGLHCFPWTFQGAVQANPSDCWRQEQRQHSDVLAVQFLVKHIALR